MRRKPSSQIENWPTNCAFLPSSLAVVAGMAVDGKALLVELRSEFGCDALHEIVHGLGGQLCKARAHMGFHDAACRTVLFVPNRGR